MTRAFIASFSVCCAAVSLAGCGGDDGAEGECVPGRVEPCPCGGDLPDGTQTCQDDGTWGGCECGSSDSDSDSDTDVDTDADTDADSDSDTDTVTCDNGTWSGDYTIASADDIAGIAGYTEITGSLTIADTDASVTGVEALHCLTTVGVGLFIMGNGDLTSLAGLDNVSEVGEHVIVDDMDALTDDLEGLGGLIAIDYYLDITNNGNLVEFDGLGALATVGQNLMVSGNPDLPDCEICELQDQLTDPPSADASDNLADACTPIEDFCDAFDDPCGGYTGDDECCLNSNPCGWEINDVCDCDAACIWDAVDCEL